MAKTTTTASDLDTASIVERLAEEKDRLFKLRVQNATGTLENTAGLRKARKEIARYETELRAREIEAARIAMTRHIKRGGKVWINVFPDKPVTEKPAETRMGSGKGNPERWVAVVRPGRILFELSYHDEEIARGALDRAIQKLPIKARIVQREEAL